MALRVNSVPKIEAMIFKPDTAWAKIHARLQDSLIRPVYL